MSVDATPRTCPRPASPGALTLAGLMLVMALAALDATIVGAAMPTIVASIGGIGLYPWAFTAYLLAATIATPFFGAIADRLGVRTAMLGAIGLFLAGSVACGLAGSMPLLVASRALQGLGAGGTGSLVFTACGLLYAPEQKGKIVMALTTVWGVSNLFGPLAGGHLVSVLPWPWLFWLNLPVGLAGAALVARRLPGPVAAGEQPPFDAAGALLFAGGLLAFLGGLAGKGGGAPMLGLTALGALLLAGFAWRQRRAPGPLLPLDLFGRPLFWVSAATGFLSCLVMYASLSYVPLYVQGVLGESAAAAGYALAPMMLGWPIGGAIGGAVVNRAGFKAVTVAGGAAIALGLLALASPWGKDGLWAFGAQGLVLGLGMGLNNAATLIAGQSAVPAERVGAATASLSLARNVGGALGLGVLGALQLGDFASRLARAGAALPASVREKLADPRAALLPGAQESFGAEAWAAFSHALAGSIHTVFAAASGVALLGFALAWFMPALRPEEAFDTRAAGASEAA